MYQRKLPSKKKVMKAIADSGGMLKQTCEILGISQSTFWKNYRNEPEIAKFIDELRQAACLDVLDTIFQQALNGDRHSQALYLKYCPEVKKAGWIEQKNLAVEVKKPLTEEEKEELKKSLFGEL